MHPLHAFIAQNVAIHLRKDRVVVWYDPPGEYTPFINELRGAMPASSLPGTQVETVTIADLSTTLCCYADSFLAVRMAVEPLVTGERPDPLLIYVAGIGYEAKNSLLLELEAAGYKYEPHLKRDAARPVLRRFHSDGFIDNLYANRDLGYTEVIELIEQTTSSGRRASLLQLAIPGASENAAIMATWLADTELDANVQQKGAISELLLLINTRLGLILNAETSLPEVRRRLWRYLLINEFRFDFSGTLPAMLTIIPAPTTQEQRDLLRKVLNQLRKNWATDYTVQADAVESEFNFSQMEISGEQLGSTDTFRFEEQTLLKHADIILARAQYIGGQQLYTERRSNFWVDRNPLRLAQWHLCNLVAELGLACEQVKGELGRLRSSGPTAWINAYAQPRGWQQMDQAQRRLESWVAGMDEDPELALALHAVRQQYARLAQQMAVGFNQALQASLWQISGIRHQTHIYSDLVKPRPESPVAYILVDALRYEMGEELAQQLAPLGEVNCTSALAVLPSITKLGMAALLPDAATSFSLSENKGKLAAQIDDVILADWSARRKFLQSRVLNMVDLELDALLQLTPKQLAAQIKGATLVVIRSQEIDTLGESGKVLLARQVMETVISNVARAVRKIVNAGIGQIIISADHGHLFADARGDDMKIDNPGGQPVELHRRCWIGYGGNASAGTVRVSGAELGYATDLDFIFPVGLGVFKAGGDLVYHHGGVSLQELVVPVVQVRVPQKSQTTSTSVKVLLSDMPSLITTRSLGVKIGLENTLFTQPVRVRPLLMVGTQVVGQAGLAIGGDFDPATQCITLQPQSSPVGVGFHLRNESCTHLRIVVLDAATDAVLAQSNEIPVKLGL